MTLVPGRFYVDTLMRLTAHFQDDECNDIDPENVVFHYRKPCGTTGSLIYPNANLARTSEGHYYADLVPAESGRWSIRWVTGAGSNTHAIEGHFKVQKSPFKDDDARSIYDSGYPYS